MRKVCYSRKTKHLIDPLIQLRMPFHCDEKCLRSLGESNVGHGRLIGNCQDVIQLIWNRVSKFRNKVSILLLNSGREDMATKNTVLPGTSISPISSKENFQKAVSVSGFNEIWLRPYMSPLTDPNQTS